MHDLVVRNGTIVDGTGRPRFVGDVGITDGKFAEVGTVGGKGRRELDADGRLVTPGWVDVHTHYDGQVTWDPHLTPSGWHGVTSVVMGNCGVGFAPVKPDRRKWVIGLMEGVEDIPGAALSEGIQWAWESFPEYLDYVESRPLALDVGTQIPHCALRAYVMDDRGAENEPPTPRDLDEMSRLVEEAMRAGALGFTTSRTFAHRTKSGEYVPGHFADDEELMALGRAMARGGYGVFEMASDVGLGHASEAPYHRELEWMVALSKETGMPVTYALLEFPPNPQEWRGLLAKTAEASREGAHVKAQVSARPTGLLLGWECTLHPFLKHPSYIQISHLPLQERLVRLRDPAVRAAILRESTHFKDEFRRDIVSEYDRMFNLGDPPNYEPLEQDSIAAMARREGRDPAEVTYDTMIAGDGSALLYRPISNYHDFDLENVREMMEHPNTFLSLSDGGAHCGVICDASMPTFNLTHWVRDRNRGPRFELERMVNMQTEKTAQVYGLGDRGTIVPGMKADLNVIDFDALKLAPPEMVYDLPADSRRMVQRVSGYDYTLVSGTVTFEKGEPTGEMPGRLVRGARGALGE